MSLFTPEIAGGVLLSRLGDVHHRFNSQRTACGKTFLPNGVAYVSHVQAIVHKLPLCHACYPAHNRHGGPNAR